MRTERTKRTFALALILITATLLIVRLTSTGAPPSTAGQPNGSVIGSANASRSSAQDPLVAGDLRTPVGY